MQTCCGRLTTSGARRNTTRKAATQLTGCVASPYRLSCVWVYGAIIAYSMSFFLTPFVLVSYITVFSLLLIDWNEVILTAMLMSSLLIVAHHRFNPLCTYGLLNCSTRLCWETRMEPRCHTPSISRGLVLLLVDILSSISSWICGKVRNIK